MHKLLLLLAKPFSVTARRNGRAQSQILFNNAILLHREGRFSEAANLCREIIEHNPKNADALHLLGVIEFQRRNLPEAVALLDRALELDPDNSMVHNNRANAVKDLARLDEALASYDRALAIRPDYPEALYNRGVILQELNRFDEALASYDRALAHRPDNADALSNRGAALTQLRRHAEALASLDRALAIKPDFAQALVNRGTALEALKHYAEALACYDRALAIKPELGPFLGGRLFCRMMICDWRGIEDDFDRLTKAIEASQNVPVPFGVLATPISATLQKKCSEIFVRKMHWDGSPLPGSQGRRRHDRIRLGYFSADFHNHATAYLIAELFERHDRSRFEVTGFSFGPAKKDEMRARLEKSLDRFIEVGALADKDIALLSRELEIDIAVDLKGLTQDGRTGIFTHRAAAVQVNYLGYPGTMGADCIDYLIADSTLIPKEQQAQYSEKIVYLPDSYQVNDTKRIIAVRRFTRAECGLPEQGFVFCCFNNSFKITPDVFDIWMRLLKTVEGSVLWLLEDNISATQNLRAEARTRGVEPGRLVFGGRMALAEHLARHRLADLFLDTFYCNAHTTASDALWAGLPVLTCLGQTFAGRVAASLLDAAGLPELIANNPGEYENLALALAANPEKLGALRDRLAAGRLTCPLFDTARYTGHLESAYAAMWQRSQAGLSPEPISISSDAEAS